MSAGRRPAPAVAPARPGSQLRDSLRPTSPLAAIGTAHSGCDRDRSASRAEGAVRAWVSRAGPGRVPQPLRNSAARGRCRIPEGMRAGGCEAVRARVALRNSFRRACARRFARRTLVPLVSNIRTADGEAGRGDAQSGSPLRDRSRGRPATARVDGGGGNRTDWRLPRDPHPSGERDGGPVQRYGPAAVDGIRLDARDMAGHGSGPQSGAEPSS